MPTTPLKARRPTRSRAVPDAPKRMTRISFTGTVRLRGEDSSILAKASNLSGGGIGVYASRAPKAGRLVEVTLDTPDGGLELGEAEVVWQQSLGTADAPEVRCGLKFRRLRPRAALLIEAIIRHGGIALESLGEIPADIEATKPHPVVAS